MSDLIPSSVLLAILQNQKKNYADTSKFPIYKTIGDASALTEEEKTDIGKNVYQFLIDSNGDLYVLSYHYSENDWVYYNIAYSLTAVLEESGLSTFVFSKSYYVYSNINGDVVHTNVISDDSYAEPYFVILETEEYPHVFFRGNYLEANVYHFSSGIILDSSSETPQYKIVFASYDVNSAKVTFVEKVLS